MNTHSHRGPASNAIGRAGRTFLAMIMGACGLLGVASDARADAPAPHPSAANYERRFLTNMIDHHAMAVMTGTICADEAVHDELAVLCESIVTTQDAEIDMMQSWLADWYSVAHEPEMKPRGEHIMDELESLNGASFEIEFMQMMVKHHEGAVKEGLRCLKKAYHPEVINLCADIVVSQRAEIELMEGWLCDWYGICH